MSWSERYRYLRSRGSDLGGREYHSMILEKLTMVTTGDLVKRPKVLPVMIKRLFFTPKFYEVFFENKLIDIVDTKFSVSQFFKTKVSLNCQITNNDKLFYAFAFAFTLSHVRLPGYSSGGYILGYSQRLILCLRHSARIGPDQLCRPSSVTCHPLYWKC